MKFTQLVAWLCGCSLLFLSMVANCWGVNIPGSLLRTFVSPDLPNTSNTFGADVAVYKDTLFISDVFGMGGRVYQFNRNGALLRTIKNPAGNSNVRFGANIDVVGDHLVVGATFGGPNASGAAYVYNATTGAFEYQLQSPSPAGVFQSFGESFASVGNFLFVGNSNHSVPMFNLDTGQLVREFQDPTPTSSNFFGEQVEAFGNRLFVAAPQQSVSPTANGLVYAYDITTGSVVSTIGSSVTDTHRLGSALATTAENNLLIGDFDTGIGSAFLFDGLSGSTLREYAQPPNTQGAWYGTPLTAMGEYSVIASIGFQRQGAVYFYNHSGSLVLTINDPAPQLGLSFVNSLAPWKNELVVGAPNGNGGRVYLFSTPVPEPNSLLLIAAVGPLFLIGTRRHYRSLWRFS